MSKLKDYPIDPMFVCLTCKTVIGPIWDDEDNQCKCDVYDYKVVRLYPEQSYPQEIVELIEAAKKAQKANSKVLGEGGLNYELWFDDILESQQSIAAALRALENIKE